jgi:hypothetical protein
LMVVELSDLTPPVHLRSKWVKTSPAVPVRARAAKRR